MRLCQFLLHRHLTGGAREPDPQPSTGNRAARPQSSASRNTRQLIECGHRRNPVTVADSFYQIELPSELALALFGCMQLIDGNAIAESIIEELTVELSQLSGKKPVVAFIRVGDDPASVSYMRKKEKTGLKKGVIS